MSRQPRKVFGFTGATKYGPLAADPPKGDSAPKAAGAPKAADMNRNSTGSGGKKPKDNFITNCCEWLYT